MYPADLDRAVAEFGELVVTFEDTWVVDRRPDNPEGGGVARRRWSEDQRPAIDALEETVLRALRRVGIQAPEEEPRKETEGRGR